MTEPNITPLARRLAEENGINWRNLEGSGPDGTIVERDILAFLAKVMAGEVELPPQPEDTQPPEELPDITQVQEALAREGVDIEELVPGITSETPPQENAPPSEEDILFEMDFEEELAPNEAPEIAEEQQEEAQESGAEEDDFFETAEGYFAAEAPPPAAEEDLLAGIEDAITETAESGLETTQEEGDSFGWEAKLEPEETPEQMLEELESNFSWDSQTEEPAPANEAPFAEGRTESVGEEEVELELTSEPEIDLAAAEDVESEFEIAYETEATEETAVSANIPVAGMDEQEQEEEPTADEEAGVAEEVGAAIEAELDSAIFPPAFRRAVKLGELEKARNDLSEAWKKEIPTSLLLFRAAERALAELEVPMRPVLGRLEGEKVIGLMVYPADNLRALYDHYLNAEEEADGLVVIDLGETPYTEILLPNKTLITLGYAGMPAGMGLLSVSGELPTDRTRFLERVAFYLERPILLA